MGFLGRAKQGQRLKASAKKLLFATDGLESLHFVRSGYWALDGVANEWRSLSKKDGVADLPLELWYANLNDPKAADRAVRLAAFSAAGFSSLAHESYRLLDRLETSIGVETEHEVSISKLARGLDGDQQLRFWRGTLEALLLAAEAPVPTEGYTNLAFISFWSSAVSQALQASTGLSNQMVSEFGAERAATVLKHLSE